MTFITGSITNANPGPTLYALIATEALALGYTLDDTVTIGGNTHKVLKSAAAGNTYGLDWYLDINYPTTGVTGGMRFAPFEGYTAASDVGLRGPFGHVNVTTLDATTYSRYGASTSALETNWLNSASATAISATLTTSAFSYWVSITRDRIIVFTSNQPTVAFYAGFFTPTAAHSAHAGASMFPLIMTAVTVNQSSNSSTNISTASAALTRLPKVSSTTWSVSVNVPGSAAAIGYFASGQVGTAVSELTGKMDVVPLPVLAQVASALSGSTSPIPSNIGALNGLAAGWVSSSATRGDVASDGTDNWAALTPSSSWGLFMECV